MDSNKIYIRLRRSVSEKVKSKLDINTTYVAFFNGKPIFEIDHMDGKWWSRPYNAPRSIPFRSHYEFVKTLKELARDLL